jgi:hypothetical protein
MLCGKRLRGVALSLAVISAVLAIIALHVRVNQREDRIPKLKKLAAEVTGWLSAAAPPFRQE